MFTGFDGFCKEKAEFHLNTGASCVELLLNVIAFLCVRNVRR